MLHGFILTWKSAFYHHAGCRMRDEKLFTVDCVY